MLLLLAFLNTTSGWLKPSRESRSSGGESWIHHIVTRGCGLLAVFRKGPRGELSHFDITRRGKTIVSRNFPYKLFYHEQFTFATKTWRY